MFLKIGSDLPSSVCFTASIRLHERVPAIAGRRAVRSRLRLARSVQSRAKANACKRYQQGCRRQNAIVTNFNYLNGAIADNAESFVATVGDALTASLAIVKSFAKPEGVIIPGRRATSARRSCKKRRAWESPQAQILLHQYTLLWVRSERPLRSRCGSVPKN